jgi:hypothetical protein
VEIDEEFDDSGKAARGWLPDWSWLHVLYFDRWFRAGLAVVVVGGIVLVSVVPKVWNTTPPGFAPPARISLLEYFQAWRLRWEFLPAAESGRDDLALRCVARGLAYNPGDSASLRQCLAWYAGHPSEKAEVVGMIPRLSVYFLRLTGTNESDSILVGHSLAASGQDPAVLEVLFPIRSKLDSIGRLQLLRPCLFDLRLNEFDEVDSLGVLTTEEAGVIRRVRGALDVGPPASKTCVSDVRQARSALKSEKVFARLLLIASFAAADLDGAHEAVERLRDLHALRVEEEAMYWRLMSAEGREAEVAGIVRSRLDGRSDLAEAEPLARAALNLGLVSEALDFVSYRLAAEPEHRRLRALQAEILLSLHRWQSLGEAAVMLRGSRSNSAFRDLGYLFEAVAEAGQGRALTARDALERVDPSRVGAARVAIECARELAVRGLGKEAFQLLKSIQDSSRSEPIFWAAMTVAALQSNQLTSLVEIAREAHERWPQRIAFANNYASALVLTRRDPGVAVQLTSQLHREQPESAVRQLFYAIALVQAEKWSEARVELDKTAGPFESAEMRALNDLARFELAWRTGDVEAAEKISSQVAIGDLPRVQVAWFDDARKKLRKARGG